VREPEGDVVALKVFRDDLASDPIYGRRILHEARAGGEVAHPHLVPIVDSGVARGRTYLAMRYGGVSLAEVIRARGRLEVDETTRIVAHVAAGLDSLHREGLVHRDVKPANILVDETGAAALGDFGLAKGRGYTALTRPGQMVGTVDYVAPELIRGERASAASDVYALGCVTYECLVGHPPFADKSVLRVSVAHLNEEPPDPRPERPDLTRELGSAVLRALAKDPAARPRTPLVYAHMLDIARRERSKPR
jgi:serine/threonine-protein kinase